MLWMIKRIFTRELRIHTLKLINNFIFKVCINMGSIIFSSGGFVGRFISILPPLPTMSVCLSRLARGRSFYPVKNKRRKKNLRRRQVEI